MVMMCDEKKYNPQGGSLLACIVTQGRLRCTCQPCATESITAMRYGHTTWFGAIECAIRWGMGTLRDWRGLSNVQCDEVRAHRMVRWVLVGAVPVCPLASPCRGASIVQFPAHNACIFCMETPLRGRSGEHTGAAPTVSFGWITRKWIMVFGRSGYRCTHLFYPVKGTFHYFFKNRLARWIASLNWRGLM